MIFIWTPLPNLKIELTRAAVNGLENRVGCYAAFGPDGACLYVGASINLKNRILNHWNKKWPMRVSGWIAGGDTYLGTRNVAPNGSFVWVWWHDKCRELERRLIQALNPKFNTFRYEVLVRDIECGLRRVRVSSPSGKKYIGFVCGETTDGEFCRVKIVGHSPNSINTWHSSRCEPLPF